MATQIQTVDDLTGETGAQTLRFAFDGVEYEIDLTQDSIGGFSDVIAPYVEVARKVTAKTRREGSGSTKSGRTSEELAKVREWAASVGIEVAARGRISADVLAQYDARDRVSILTDLYDGPLTGETVAVEGGRADLSAGYTNEYIAPTIFPDGEQRDVTAIVVTEEGAEPVKPKRVRGTRKAVEVPEQVL